MPNVTEARPAPLHRAGAGRFTRQERLAYTMLVPILGSIFLIVTYPFVLAVIQSLQATNGGAFVGLQNYVTGLENPLLYEALAATAVYAALVLPTEILLGLVLALAVHRGIKSTALRALFFGMAIVPLVIPPIAVGVIARLMYAPSYGAINHILMLTGITHDEINWLGQPITAMPAVASVDVWQWTPFVYLVLFSGFLTVPPDAAARARVARGADHASARGDRRALRVPHLLAHRDIAQEPKPAVPGHAQPLSGGADTAAVRGRAHRSRHVDPAPEQHRRLRRNSGARPDGRPPHHVSDHASRCLAACPSRSPQLGALLAPPPPDRGRPAVLRGRARGRAFRPS